MENNARSVALSLTEGTTVRDLFYNGLLDRLNGAGFPVTVYTEAARVPAFVADWQRPGVDIVPYAPVEHSKERERAYGIRRRLIKLGKRPLLDAWIRFERRRTYAPPTSYLEQFRKDRPAVFLGTNAYQYAESELISTANAFGIPSLSLVRSWDNVHKGLHSRPDKLAVWSETNRQEAIELEGYAPEDVVITGGPQFDAYFAPEAVWTRERLARHFKLDPTRPILLFASFGHFKTSPDETCWMDLLVRALDKGLLPGNPQIICRLHPTSRVEHFMTYAGHPDVRLSHVERYYPTLSWYMTRDDVILVGNMLRHADVVLTPGSTFTLEGAIFDRPTLVPLFHTYQPEKCARYFNARTLGKHFGRLEKLNLVPILRKEEEFLPAIERALRQPEWYREQRCQIVSDYIHFTDGQSTERLADLVTRLANGQS